MLFHRFWRYCHEQQRRMFLLTSLAQQFENLQLKDNPQKMSPNQSPGDLFERSLSQSCFERSSEACEVSLMCSPDISYEEEWILTPQSKTNLSSLSGFIRSVSGRDVSPARGQLHLPVGEISPSTRYYKKKSKQVCKIVLDCMATCQSQALFELMTDEIAPDESIPKLVGSDVVQKLITLYEESNSWITKQEFCQYFFRIIPKLNQRKW